MLPPVERTWARPRLPAATYYIYCLLCEESKEHARGRPAQGTVAKVRRVGRQETLCADNLSLCVTRCHRQRQQQEAMTRTYTNVRACGSTPGALYNQRGTPLARDME